MRGEENCERSWEGVEKVCALLASCRSSLLALLFLLPLRCMLGRAGCAEGLSLGENSHLASAEEERGYFFL